MLVPYARTLPCGPFATWWVGLGSRIFLKAPDIRLPPWTSDSLISQYGNSMLLPAIQNSRSAFKNLCLKSEIAKKNATKI